MVATSPLAVLLYLCKVRFVQTGHMLQWMGHLVSEPDLYQKSVLLGWAPKYRLVILTVRANVANPCILGYWEKYIKVISNRLLIVLLRPLEATSFLQFSTSLVYIDRKIRIKPTPAHYLIEAKYESEFGGSPLLALSEEHHAEGWQKLRFLGVPQGSWFVCLHIREGGYHPDNDYHSYRDVDVNSYHLAINEITRKGGWVIRMGDQSMKPLPSMERVIDYAHSDIRSDWMDVFCFSQCRFLLGTTSGASEVAKVFGVPAALSNYIPMGHGAYSVKDIWIPKLYWSKTENRYFTFAEVMLSKMRMFGRTEMFTEADISWVDNSPEEIRDLVIEMMERIDGHTGCTPNDEDLQACFMTLLEHEPMYATNAKVGRDFLRKYAWLLPDQDQMKARITGDTDIASQLGNSVRIESPRITSKRDAL